MAIGGAIFKGLKGAYQTTKGIPGGAAKGSMGLLGVAGTGMSLFAAHQTHAKTYGTGGALAIGAAEAGMFLLPLPIALPAAAAVYGLPAMKDLGTSIYRDNRRLNMGKPIDDRFGTVATMRQRSASSLQRGRSLLGNEARMLHY